MKTPRLRQRVAAIFFACLLPSVATTSPSFAAEKPTPRPTRLPRVSASLPSNPIVRSEPDGIVRSGALTTSPSVELAEDSSQTDGSDPRQWLRSTTAQGSLEIARRLIDQAGTEYDAKAWLSAETTCWNAIRHCAAAIDLASAEVPIASMMPTVASADQRFQAARSAIIEARDFAGVYGTVDDAAIGRISRGHRTQLIDQQNAVPMAPHDASDRYLDYARIQLASLASESPDTAQALDLLAAIYLGRADAMTLPSGTALCLRRAALQGQPANASLASRLGMHLADVGLNEEARWALQQSLSIRFDPPTASTLVALMRSAGDNRAADQLLASIQSMGPAATPTPKSPEIIELSPSEFASVSKPVMNSSPPYKPATAMLASDRQLPASLVSTKSNSSEKSNASEQSIAPELNSDPLVEPSKEPGIVRRFIGRFRKPW